MGRPGSCEAVENCSCGNFSEPLFGFTNFRVSLPKIWRKVGRDQSWQRENDCLPRDCTLTTLLSHSTTTPPHDTSLLGFGGFQLVQLLTLSIQPIQPRSKMAEKQEGDEVKKREGKQLNQLYALYLTDTPVAQVKSVDMV